MSAARAEAKKANKTLTPDEMKSHPGLIMNNNQSEIILRIRCVDEFRESLACFLDFRGHARAGIENHNQGYDLPNRREGAAKDLNINGFLSPEGAENRFEA